jgi:leucyl-tRNA synthetase
MAKSADTATQGGAAPAAYEPSAIETKWQARWEADALYVTPDDDPEGRDRWYLLTMFPYTSGDLHIGHWYAIAPSDTAARYQRMRGKNVLFPIGFDAFGLPAENAAIRNGTHPMTWTYANVETMRAQLKRMGSSFDWTREVVTADPEYYRWTQWWFLQLLKHDLAYRKMAPANWCPSCQTVLANEQVIRGDDEVGRCDRCESVVETRDLEQWFFRITKYADELLDFSGIDWPSRIETMQTNWIGRSEGAEIRFSLEPAVAGANAIPVFTTRPDTVFGVTYLVLAPEHPLVDAITVPAQRQAVETYVAAARQASEIERQSTTREKSGVFTGGFVQHPLTGADVPVWVADYALVSYGTGAVMGVPAHDTRDFAFATKFELPIPVVIAPSDWDGQPLADAYVGDGRMVNSGEFDGLAVEDGKTAVSSKLKAAGLGGPQVTYRIRDWLISRSVTGARRFRLCTASAAAPCRCPRSSCRCYCRMTRSSSRRASRHWRGTRVSPTSLVPTARGRRAGRPTPWTPSCALRGTCSATSTRTTTLHPSTWSWRGAGSPSTSTPAAPSTPLCTCSMRASLPRPRATWVSCRSESPSSGSSTKGRSSRAGRRCRRVVATWSTRTSSWAVWERTQCVPTSCSWGLGTKAVTGTTAASKAPRT